MKNKYILPILLLFLFSKCEKVVDVEVPSTTPKLIIDASFQIFFDESPVTAETLVKLRLSADYFDETIPTVTNASVFLTNLSNGNIINFNDANLDGDYEPTNSFIPEENTTYELTVVYNNETYKATAARVKSTPLTNVIQGDETLFSGEETEIQIFFTDDGSVDNYYVFDFSNSLFLALEDRFFNGADYSFSSFYQEDEIELPTTVTIKMSGVSKEYYTYFNILIDQSGQNAGGPFESVPSSLLGNVINTTNEDNFPLGYFQISETDTFTLDLVEKD
jgi:hypothetical protein